MRNTLCGVVRRPLFETLLKVWAYLQRFQNYLSCFSFLRRERENLEINLLYERQGFNL